MGTPGDRNDDGNVVA